ncbi:MAG TPA: IS982 family transposase [Burkholderiales bacterium]|nr:IS982 family transposase [Burkholderiales bacterium]
MDMVELYVIIDDFCKKIIPKLNKLLRNKHSTMRNRAAMLSMSEIVFILILFPHFEFKCFKWFYINKICGEYKSYFRQLPSYNRFVELMPKGILALSRLLNYLMYEFKKQSLGINYIDSTRIAVCHNKRNTSHKVFASIAEIGKSTMGWFLGFKLHMIINTKGQIISLSFTKGNCDDRMPVMKLIKGLFGKLFGDKGYIKKELTEELHKLGITLITPMKKNMKAKLIPINVFDLIMSKKRILIESVFNILKNKLQLCHTRHRSIKNFCVHVLSVLIGYQLSPVKPSINLEYSNLMDF